MGRGGVECGEGWMVWSGVECGVGKVVWVGGGVRWGSVGWVRGREAHKNDTVLLVATHPCLAKHCG